MKTPTVCIGSLRFFVVTLAVLLVAEPAFAAKRASTAKRLAILPPTAGGAAGTPVKTKAINSKIVKALKQNKIHVVEGRRLQKTMRKEGAPSSDSDWVKLARKLKVDGFVASTLTRDGNNQNLDVTIRNGADGSLAGQESFAAQGKPKKLGAVVAGTFWKKLGPAVQQTAAPTTEEQPIGLPPPVVGTDSSSGIKTASDEAATKAPETKEPATEAAKPAAPPQPAKQASAPSGEHERTVAVADVSARPSEKSEERGDDGDSMVARAAPTGGRFERAEDGMNTYEVEADFRTLRRTFHYAPVNAAQHYLLNFNPVAGGRAAWYPIRYAGLFLQGEFGAGLKTDSYPTGTREIVGGVQGRYPFSFGQLGASATFFNHAFLIQDTNATDDPARVTLSVPNTVYAGVRLGGRGLFTITDRIHVAVDAGYRLVTGLGGGEGQVKSNSYFPNAGNPTGFDGSASVGVAVGSMFEIRAGADYRIYRYGRLQGLTAGGLNIDASAATDQYFAISLGVAALAR